MGELVHPDRAAPNRVKLAREASFNVGRLTAHPSTRQIICGTERQTLEPRVMQVLVALARAGGAVVSKEELIDCCWHGRIVGEDAINRVVSRLRHIAETIGGDSFRVETIRGVGYRLVDSEDCSTEVGNARISDTRWRVSRRGVVAGTLGAGAVAAAGIWLFPRAAHKPVPLAQQYYRRGLE